MRHDLAAWTARWWAGEAGLPGHAATAVLWPAETLFRAAVRARELGYRSGWLPVERASIPTVSVGNLAVGGAGKTPVAAWIAGRMRELGRRPGIVLRGYGRDEILVHGELNPEVPVFVGSRRSAAIASAAAAGCDLAILDDGFQHRAVARDLDLVLVSADSWVGPQRLLPRGPWREPLSALRRAHLVLVTRKAASREAAARVVARVREAAPAAGVAVCALAIDGIRALPGAEEQRPASQLAGERVLAVTSIAQPAPFAAQLTELGAEVELFAFRDHHEFTAADAEEIAHRAAGRTIVVTRKEAVKLRSFARLQDHPLFFATQRVELELGGDEVEQALKELARAWPTS